MDRPPNVQTVARPERMEPPRNPRLARMRFLSRLLDNSIMLPGGYRIGLDPIIGLIPLLGDFLASTLSFWLIYDAARLGIRKRVLARMAGNVLVETLFGAVPVLGDLADAAWKANARNMRLVELHYSPGNRERSFASMAAAFLLALLMFWALLLGGMYLGFQFLVWLFS
jgi:hypothetical protein